MAVIAGTLGIVGREEELKKWRRVAIGLLVGTVVVAIIFGPSIYIDPALNLLRKP